MTDPSPPPAVAPLADFVALSVILTGIAQPQLDPPLDPHDSAQNYLAYARAHSPSDFPALMALFAQHRSDPAPAVLAAIAAGGDTIVYIARTVTLMWFLGAWYEPDALKAYVARCASVKPTDPSPFGPDFVVISSDAYTQGWSWRIGQAHPMGYSDLRFGYWNAAPPSLADYVGGPSA